LTRIHHDLHIYACLGEPIQNPFPILGIHDVGGFFAPIEAVFVERAEYSVFLVAGVEESADMILPGEIASCYFH